MAGSLCSCHLPQHWLHASQNSLPKCVWGAWDLLTSSQITVMIHYILNILKTVISYSLLTRLIQSTNGLTIHLEDFLSVFIYKWVSSFGDYKPQLCDILAQWFLKFGPWTSNTSITQEVGRNVESRALPQLQPRTLWGLDVRQATLSHNEV